MLKKTIKYTDYFGNEREEDFYFNLSKAELTTMEYSTEGGFAEYIDRIIRAKDMPTVMNLFEEIIMKSYGQKSDDGKRFVKSAELSEAFKQSAAYDELFMELIGDNGEEAAAEFIRGILPQDLQEQLESENNRQTVAPA